MMITLVILFVLCFSVLCLLVFHKDRQSDKRWELARMFHNDLFDKICELRNDPLMTDEKWREWLPVCRYSDDLLKQYGVIARSLEGMVRREIEPDEQPDLR